MISAVSPPVHLPQPGVPTAGAAGLPPPATPAELDRAARQFEAVLLRQLLAPVMEPLMQGGLSGGEGQGGGIYAYFLTDTLATTMASGSGLGLGEMWARQLAARGYAGNNAES